MKRPSKTTTLKGAWSPFRDHRSKSGRALGVSRRLGRARWRLPLIPRGGAMAGRIASYDPDAMIEPKARLKVRTILSFYDIS
jgi:hypothetical protein